jgi:hypothetical protein
MGSRSARTATASDTESGVAVDPRELRYLPLDYLLAHKNPENPKDHDIGDIMASIMRHGFVGYVTFDPSVEMTVVGHGRLDTLAAMRKEGYEPPPPAPVPQIQTRYGVLVQVSDRVQEDLLADLLVKYGWEKFLRLSEDE